MNNADKISHIEANNNTKAWENNGWIYIDSMKSPEMFAKEVASLGGKNFQVMHRVENCEENMMILWGEESTNLVIGGKKTQCHVMRFQ